MKAALIGCGWQGKRHVQAFQELGVELVCMIDINPSAVRERFPEYPADRIYNDSRKALEIHQPDVVSIATNAAARLENVRACVECGIRKIFLEKPMATTLKDAKEIIRLAREGGCLLAVNHLRRWNPNYMKLKDAIRNDIIGKVRQMYAHTGSYGLGNEGTHVIDKMRLITESEVAWVVGQLDLTGTPNPRGPQYKDPGGWGVLMFRDGTRAFIDTCEDTCGPPVWEIVGTYGRMFIEELNNRWSIMARDPQDRSAPLTKVFTPVKPLPVFETLPWDVKEFTKLGLKELIFDNRTSCTGEDGLKNLEAIMAIHVSHRRGGQRVELPLSEEFDSLEVAWA